MSRKYCSASDGEIESNTANGERTRICRFQVKKLQGTSISADKCSEGVNCLLHQQDYYT